jgi:hypothetical protein
VPSAPDFLPASGLSNSSDMARCPVPIGRLFSAPNSKLFAGNYGCNRRRMARSRATPGTECEGCALRSRRL